MAVDIRTYFNEDLPAAMATHRDAAKQIGGRFQFNITGEGGGEWFVDASDYGPRCYPGNPDGADVTITLAVEDFQKVYENPQANFMQLFFSGKIKMAGNQTLAMKMVKLFTLGK